MAKFSRQNINKITVALNHTLNQIDCIDIFRAFHTLPPPPPHTHTQKEHTQVNMEHFLGQTTC